MNYLLLRNVFSRLQTTGFYFLLLYDVIYMFDVKNVIVSDMFQDTYCEVYAAETM